MVDRTIPVQPGRSNTGGRFGPIVHDAWRALRRRNPPLAFLVASMTVLLAACLIGIALDPRSVTGAPVWLKPAKFAVSIAIYGATLAWLLTFLPARSRVVAVASWATTVLLVGEMVVIVLQAARGTTSHFNNSSPLDGALFAAMGAMIAMLWLAAVVVAFALWRRGISDPAMAVAVRAGATIAVVGMAVAFLMTSQPSAPGTPAGIAGAHAVGVLDGGPGLPIVGWSTVGGDLRIPHFVGLHALQVLPLLAWGLARFGPSWFTAAARARLVLVAAVGYLGLVALLTWQALRGQPLLAPDAATGTLLAGLVGAVAIAAATVVAIARPPAFGRSVAEGTP